MLKRLMVLIMSSFPLPTFSKFSVSKSLNQVIVAGGLESTSQLRVRESWPSVRVVWDAVMVTLGTTKKELVNSQLLLHLPYSQ